MLLSPPASFAAATKTVTGTASKRHGQASASNLQMIINSYIFAGNFLAAETVVTMALYAHTKSGSNRRKSAEWYIKTG
jgi:hypothetical protein